ncbi:MAG TPA: choice-of-anchor Q domain-containing protein [Pirellulales bacterium]|nr:choice-of-anchor Q domain-containing protein [Pirellulales bacterium]
MTDSPTFNIVNQSQFAPGDAVVSSNSYFLGAQNFDTGTQTIGGFVHPFGVTTGVQASVDLNGTAGLNLGYFVNSGSFDASYNSNLTQTFNDPTAIGPVSINTSAALSNGTLSTQSPSVGAFADAVVQMGGSLDLKAAAFGQSYSSNTTFGGGFNQELFSFNRNNDQSINVLGQPITVGGTVSHKLQQQVSETPPVTIDTTVTTQNNPLGAQESLDVSLSQADTGAAVSANLGSASESVPVINLSASQGDTSGALSASSTDDSSTQLASLQLQMGAAACAVMNLPPVATTTTYTAGPASVSLTPMSFTLDPTLYAHQSVSATPLTTITYVFDHPVNYVLNGTSGNGSQVTFNPGDALNIAFDGTPIHVTPYLNLDLKFHNTIALDAALNANLTVGQISASLNGVPQPVQDALGLPLNAGPLYQQDFNLANAPAITAYDKTFDVNESQALAPFTLGGNYQFSLNVTRSDDPNATGGTLRAAVNNADAHPSSNGDVIYLGPGTYNLTNAVGAGQVDDGTVGNLFVTDPNLTIIGAGEGQTIINASSLGDRVFQVRPQGGLHLVGLTVTGGNPSNGVRDDGTLGRSGGGILNDGTLTLDHVDVSQNTATDGGGGIYNASGQITITNSEINSNQAAFGGGLRGFGTTTIQYSTLHGNVAAFGGAIDQRGGLLTIVGSNLNSNKADEDGGAIELEGAAQLVAIDDFFNLNDELVGGALFFNSEANNTSPSTITGSTFANSAASAIADFADPLTVTNSTFVGNSQAALSLGGAASASVTSSTITANTFGVVVDADSQLTLHNDIVAKNQQDISGAVLSEGHNLIGDGSGASGLVSSDLVGSAGSPLDPMLGPLQDNGGSTLTLTPLSGSPAIDAGDDNGAPATDQRGFPRPSGAHVDIGAVEYVHSPLTIPDFSDDNVTISTSTFPPSIAQNITLRDAVTLFNAQGGSNEIDLHAGTYTLTHTADNPTPTGRFGALVVQNEDLTIKGAGAGQTIIDASALGDRAFQILSSGHLHLIGVTITGGNSSGNGGAIGNEGTLSLKNSSVANSVTSGLGGAIFSDSGTTLTLDDATISGNSAENGGGVVIINAASAAISDGTTISGNIAKADGGGIAVMGTLTITGSTITGNSAGQVGGGIVTSSSGASVTISQSTLSNNKAQVGGALFSNSPVVIDDSTLMDNVAQGAAGQDGSWVWDASPRHGDGGGGGGAGLGAAIYNGSTLTVSNSTLVGNQAVGGHGGQVDTPGVSVGGAGGGLQGGAGGSASDGAAGQFASGGGGGGSGAPPYNGGPGGFGGGGGGAGGLTENALHQFTTSGQGGAGGQFAGAGGNDQTSIDQSRSVITYPGGGGGGAGVGGALFDAGQATLLNDTIADNAASGGQGGLGPLGPSGAAGSGVAGGIYVYSGSVTSQNTVVAGNTANQDRDVSGSFTSNGHNFIGNVGSASGFAATAHDQVGGGANPALNPQLGPLQNNGGTTLTMVPLPGSPLIDAGKNGGVLDPVDQAGGKRIIGGTVDIGAVENQTLFVNTTQDSLSIRSLRQAVTDADALGGQQTITLAAGTYQLSNLGHLDIHGVNLSIVGAGAGQTIIDASQANDRDFKVAGGATLQLSGLTVEKGIASNGDGGDILNAGTLVISKSELNGGSALRGGAIANEPNASLSIDSSTLDGNTAMGEGGAIVNISGSMNISNTTISGNTAHRGGGIGDSNPTSIALINDTIAGNTATLDGGGIVSANVGNIFGLKNTLVAGNQARSNPDVEGTFLSQGHNLIGNVGTASGFNTASGDQLGSSSVPINPQLGPLQNNGGPTPTMLPAANSPAVDAGDNNGAPNVDQRGIRRPLGGTVDIGSVEAAFLTVTRFDDGNLPGQLRRAISDANALGGSHTITLTGGTYTLNDQALGELAIDSNVTIVGAGASETTIDASGLGDRAFRVLSNATLNLSGVTIEGGSTTGGGGAVWNNGGTVIISHCELKDNTAQIGGAVDDDSAPFSGLASLTSATTGIDAVTGAIVVADASQFPKARFAIQIDQEQMVVSDVSGNTLFVSRGANGTTAASHTFGSTVSVVGGSASSVLSAVSSNLDVDNIRSFPSKPGFLIQIDSELMQVVAISTANKTVSVVRGVDGTSAAPHQAGATISLVNLVIDSSTLDGNSATDHGGAVYDVGGMSITNSTLSGNSAKDGGGISYHGTALTLTNDTIAGNTATSMGGIDSERDGSAAARLHNTIVATNSASSTNPDVGGSFVSLGHNLIGIVGSANGLTNGANGDQVGTSASPINAQLSPLRDNGGGLPTIALLPGSPAIDAGDDTGAPATDERSILRNQGSHVDIGAYELAYDLEVDLPGGGTQSVFTDLGNGLTQMTSPSGAFKTFTFENPSHSLTIVSEAGGNDTITLGPLEPGFAVGIVGDGQGDTIHLQSGAVLNPIGGETILGGDTLSGVGTVSTPLTIDSGATLAPNAGDPLTMASSLTFQSGSTFVAAINGASPDSGYDQVVVTGSGSTINLAGATLNASRLASFVPNVGETFTIISNQTGNAILGTFAGLPEGHIIDLGGVTFSISYQGGASGHDVVLTAVATLTVTANPTSTSVNAFGTATFTAAATGWPLPNVAWQVSTDSGQTWSAILGATGNTLTVSNVSGAQNGNEYEAVFTNAAGSVTTTPATLTVSQVTPTIASVNPVSLTYGTALNNSQLSGTVSFVVGGQTVAVPGTFGYTTAAGTVLNAGGGQIEDVTFTPTDTADYTTAKGTVTVNVDKATPIVNWATPAAMTYGTALSSAQLDATSSWTVATSPVNVLGTLTYTPSTDTLLGAGSHTLNVAFTPSDTTDFTTATGSVTVIVNPYAFTYTIGNDSQVYGSPANLTSDLPSTVNTGINGETLGISSASTGDTATANVGGYAITGALSSGTGFLSNYSVTLVSGTLTVNPYALSYTIGNDSQAYGSPANLTNDLPSTISTGVNGETLGIGYASTGDTTTANVGSYAITGTLSNGTGLASNYSVTPINGTLTVNPYAFSYTIANDSQVYGSPANLAKDLGTIISTGVNGETLGIAYASTGDTNTANVGSYAITGALSNGTGLLSNYHVRLTNGSLTVNPYALSYTIANDSQVYGSPANLAKDLGTTISTGVNGETLDIAYTSTGDTATANVGGYAITGALSNGTGLLSNYSVTLTNGTLTVNPYAFSYTIGNDSQTYGSPANLGHDLPSTISTGVNGEMLGIAYASTGDTATANVGSYAITGSLSNGTGLASNYSVTSTNGTLTVNPYAFSYTIGNDSQVYGSPANLAKDLGATISTGVNGETLGISYTSTGDTAKANVGSYGITGSLSNGIGLASNYSVTLTNGTLTVNPYAFSYTIGNDSQVYGSPANLAKDLGTTISTGVNGETLGIAYASTGDTATANVGHYAMTGTLANGSGLLSNYSVTLTNGTLTVNPYSFSYTIGNDSQAYGVGASLAADLPSAINTGVNGQTLSIAYASAGDTATALPGAYKITGTLANGTGLLSNYSVTLVPGTLTVEGPGVSVVVGRLYLVGGNTNDEVFIRPIGSSKTGSTGIEVDADLNKIDIEDAKFGTDPAHPITSIVISGFGGNDNIFLAWTLTIPAVVAEGDGNDNIVLGGGNNAVTAGNGNDNVALGNGNNTIVAGNGNDNVLAGNGNNNIKVGSGNDNVIVGDGNNVVVAGGGHDLIWAGNGDNLIVGGLGHDYIVVGNGNNILIDGSVQLSQDALGQVLNEWIAGDITDVRKTLSGAVTYNQTNANTLIAGKGLDWFWDLYGHDHTNRKSTDLLN